MKILLHSGPGVISQAIKLQTRSPWNHASLLFDDGIVIEAREFKGVVRTPVAAILQAIRREPRLRVAVYDFVTPLTALESHAARGFAESQIGSGYDYLDIARFLFRRPSAENDKWFCSEFAAAVAHVIRRPLFRETMSWEVPPAWLPRSLALRHVGSLPDYLR